jgi:hypothetical protein
MSRILLSFLFLVVALAVPLRAAGEDPDPFVKRFGAIPQDHVSLEFRQQAVRYGTMHLGALSALGTLGMKDRKGFEEYRKTQVNPELEKLLPKTEGEKKMKAAAVGVIDAMAYVVDPALVPEDQREATAAFLKSCALPGEEASEFNQMSGMVIRYLAYATGMTLEELQRKTKEVQEAEGKK